MFQTLGYFLELCVSLYFLSVVTLFLINVCEFMPMTRHGAVEKSVWTPKNPDGAAPKFVTSEPPTVAETKSLQRSEPGEEEVELTEETKSTYEKKKQSSEDPTAERGSTSENQIKDASGEEELVEQIATPGPEARDSPDAVASAEPGDEADRKATGSNDEEATTAPPGPDGNG